MKNRTGNDTIAAPTLQKPLEAGAAEAAGGTFSSRPKPPAELVSVAYVSSAVIPFTDAELVELLTQSRARNTLAGITGMLVYKNGNFMQLIEGEAPVIDALIAKIRKDPRHCGLVTLLRRTITEREFQSWSMGFRNLHAPEAHAIEGYSELLNYELTGKEFQKEPSLAQKLLLSFKKNM